LFVAGMYIELHAASAFSFLQGASLPEALVDRAAELGYPAIALLDRDGVYAAPRFHKAATAAGIKPIIGAELTIAGSLTSHVSRLNKQVEREASAFAKSTAARRSTECGGWLAERPRSSCDPNTSDLRLGTSNFLLPVLCESRQGYQNLCRLVTEMKLA